MLAGSIVQGRRLAEAKGRDIYDDDSDTAKKVRKIEFYSLKFYFKNINIKIFKPNKKTLKMSFI